METTITNESQLTKKQTKKFFKTFTEDGRTYRLVAEVRWDDECGNGYNTFAITGDIYDTDKRVNPREGGWIAGGCVHDEIAKHIPELAPFIKWHLCSPGGPMHYIANTVYLAGNRDYNGRAAGEPSSFDKVVQFGDFPIRWRCNDRAFMKWLETAEGADFEVIAIEHVNREHETYKFAPKYTLGGAPDKWHECPFDTEAEALEFLAAMRLGYKVVSIPTAWSEGKVRQLDAARNAAIWPEATDEELSLPKDELKAKLEARLPGLLAEFRAAIESLGFVW